MSTKTKQDRPCDKAYKEMNLKDIKALTLFIEHTLEYAEEMQSKPLVMIQISKANIEACKYTIADLKKRDGMIISPEFAQQIIYGYYRQQALKELINDNKTTFDAPTKTRLLSTLTEELNAINDLIEVDRERGGNLALIWDNIHNGIIMTEKDFIYNDNMMNAGRVVY